MAPLIDQIRIVMARRATGPKCIACGRRIASPDVRARLSRGAPAHRRCATYDVRR